MKTKAILRLGLLLCAVLLAFSTMSINNPEIPQPKDTPIIALRQSFAASANPINNPDSHSDDVIGSSVYVCKSAGAKKYHYKETCRGLSACTHEVVKMEKNDAEGRGLGLCGWED